MVALIINNSWSSALVVYFPRLIDAMFVRSTTPFVNEVIIF